MANPSDSSRSYDLSPYHLHASLICYVLLNGENYSEWSIEMYNTSQAKQKLGFIDGNISKPSSNPDLARWLANNLMIIGWIRTSITPKVCFSVTFVPEAHKLWENLRSRFAVKNRVREIELEGEIANCKQAGQSVLDYFSCLTTLWDEMQNYKAKHNYMCGAAANIEKDYEKGKVHKFLLGLDKERFSFVCSTVIGEDPIPDLNVVYARDPRGPTS